LFCCKEKIIFEDYKVEMTNELKVIVYHNNICLSKL